MVFGVGTPKRVMLATARFLVLVVLLTGCASSAPGNALVTKGPAAEMEAALYVLIFWIAVAVFVVVEAILIWTAIRFRRRANDGIPAQTHGHTGLEIGWTIIPFLILAYIAIPTLTTISSATAAPTGPDVIKVKVIGHQWWWEFQYPDLGIVTSDELHIPVGQKISLDVGTADVIHSFWVPKLGGKIQAIPNQKNTTWIQADEAGTYPAQCFQLCGLSHANMRFIVVAETKDAFQAWAKNQAAPAAQPVSPDAQAGGKVFAGGACIGCHTINGTAAAGKVGPNLTHIGSHLTLAGATLTNNPEQLAVWLHNPPGVKPGSIMPNLNLTDDQVKSLVAYLEELK
ncbi:MAG TPA: cytochrome c oxidase subunit II [Chloroflexota bacterium]|nr:cytochrome c oxidase subunit II [Chloroflexota bacterium]